MKIFFNLDEDEEIDTQDLVGEIAITDGQTILSVESTYLDSWFDVLIDGLNGLYTNKKIILEILEEPEVIIFEHLREGFKIIYGKQELFFSNLNEFHQSLLTAAQEFLSQLEQDKNSFSDFPILIKIKNFIEESLNKKSINNAIKTI